MDTPFRKCSGTDTEPHCSEAALHVVTVPHIGQRRFACEAHVGAPEVTARQPLAEFFAKLNSPEGDALLAEEQEKMAAFMQEVMAERVRPAQGASVFNPAPPRRERGKA